MEINTREEFNEYMKTFHYSIKKNQYEFYARILDFMKGDKKFLINPAGMGLGKTFPTTTIISQFLEEYDLVFIANPTTPLKYVWMGNIHQAGILERTAIWPSKRDVCIYKQILNDRDFPLSKCDDDCPCQINCKNDRTYTPECRKDYERYISIGKNATPLSYYNKIIKERNIITENLKNIEDVPFNCLYAPTRMGLRDLYIPGTRKIILGDYNGFLMSAMFKVVTLIELNTKKTILVVDEGHLINSRARGHFSNYVYLKSGLFKLEKEFEKYKDKLPLGSQKHILFMIERFKELGDRLNNNLIKLKDKIGYNFEN